MVFPAHPRTLKNLEKAGKLQAILAHKNIVFTGPLGYFEFQNLAKNAFCCLTDSGGIQEETTFAQVPCLTLRPNTERPITTSKGSNTLLDNDVDLVLKYIKSIKEGAYKKGEIPELWDGKATERILKVLNQV